MSASMPKGDVVGKYLLTGTPSELQRNFAKFHLSPCPMMPFGKLAFKYLYSGSVCSPLSHSILPRTGKVAPLDFANSCISALVPGSWLPKLLHGNASISNPLLLFCKYCFID